MVPAGIHDQFTSLAATLLLCGVLAHRKTGMSPDTASSTTSSPPCPHCGAVHLIVHFFVIPDVEGKIMLVNKVVRGLDKVLELGGVIVRVLVGRLKV